MATACEVTGTRPAMSCVKRWELQVYSGRIPGWFTSVYEVVPSVRQISSAISSSVIGCPVPTLKAPTEISGVRIKYVTIATRSSIQVYS